MGFSKFPAALIFAAAVVVTVASSRVADAADTSCASSLAPCAQYFNTTGTPPESCCGPVKLAVENDLTCLCYLFTTPGLLASYGINVTQALGIPARCGIVYTPCGEASSPTSNSPPPASSLTSNSPPPAKSGYGNDGVGRIAWTGLLSLLLFSASMTLY